MCAHSLYLQQKQLLPLDQLCSKISGLSLILASFLLPVATVTPVIWHESFLSAFLISGEKELHLELGLNRLQLSTVAGTVTLWLVVSCQGSKVSPGHRLVSVNMVCSFLTVLKPLTVSTNSSSSMNCKGEGQSFLNMSQQFNSCCFGRTKD